MRFFLSNSNSMNTVYMFCGETRITVVIFLKREHVSFVALILQMESDFLRLGFYFIHPLNIKVGCEIFQYNDLDYQ